MINVNQVLVDVKTIDDYVSEVKVNKESIVPGNEGIGEWITKVLIAVDSVIFKTIDAIVTFIKTKTISVDDIEKYKTMTPSIKDLLRVYNKVKSMLNPNNAILVYDILVPVIPGLNVMLEEYADIMLNVGRTLDKQNKILEDYYNTINVLIGADGNEFNRLLPSKGEIDRLNGIISDIESNLTKIVSGDNSKDMRKLKNIMKKVTNLPDTMKTTIDAGRYYRVEELRNDNELLNKSVKLTKGLVNDLASKKKAVNKNDIDRLVEYMGLIAKYYTLKGTAGYLYLSLTDTLFRAGDKIIEKLK